MRRLAQTFLTASCVICASCENAPTAPTAPTTISVPETRNAPATTPAGSAALFTFSIDTECRSEFPENTQQRTYSAGQAYSSNVLALGGAVFERYEGLDWNIVYRSATDTSSAYWFQDPPIAERLSTDAYLVIYGTSEYGSTSTYGEWPFWGTVSYCSARKPGTFLECAVREISCKSNRHRLRVALQ